jgi:hypothetical protein
MLLSIVYQLLGNPTERHFIKCIKVAPNEHGKATWKSIQAGVILTTSILDLQNVFLNEKKYSFLLTSRFTYCLENVFSQIRSRLLATQITKMMKGPHYLVF